MARCSRGLRPANIVAAAPSNGISTGSGVNTDGGAHRDPSRPGQRVQFVGFVGVARVVRDGAGFVEGRGFLIGELRRRGCPRDR